jgi:hypothetical protein
VFRRLPLCLVVVLAAAPAPLSAQFEDAQGGGPRLDQETVQRVTVGMRIEAIGGPCGAIYGTTAVPLEWPEQEVKLVTEDVSPSVRYEFQQPAPTVRQMVIEVPSLAAGQEAHALVTFEIRRRTLLAPDDTAAYRIPKKLDRGLKQYLGPSPYIEVRHAKIRAAAKEAVEGKQAAWDQAEAIYDYARDKVEYKNGPLKGAVRALRDGYGDCEELSSLFIAMCRASGIPARTVWVPGHCYAEFYLEDEKGQGYWFPCQPAGARAFGGIPETRAILQKGDNFKLPEHGKPQRYVAEFLRGEALPGAVKPKVKFVRDVIYAAE